MGGWRGVSGASQPLLAHAVPGRKPQIITPTIAYSLDLIAAAL